VLELQDVTCIQNDGKSAAAPEDPYRAAAVAADRAEIAELGD
jgi:hypothetical protein